MTYFDATCTGVAVVYPDKISYGQVRGACGIRRYYQVQGTKISIFMVYKSFNRGVVLNLLMPSRLSLKPCRAET